MRRIAAILLCAAALHAAAQAPATDVVRIEVNLARPVGSYKPITNWFGYDESNYTTMPYGEQLLSELHALSAAQVTIRTHRSVPALRPFDFGRLPLLGRPHKRRKYGARKSALRIRAFRMPLHADNKMICRVQLNRLNHAVAR